MRFLSWNVAGLRSKLKKGYLDFIRDDEYDVVCLQETKALESQVSLPDWVGQLYPYQVWVGCDGTTQRKGLNGVCIWSKHKPQGAFEGMKLGKCEGRIVGLEFKCFNIVTVYTPNSQAKGSERNEFREDHWDPAFRKWIAQKNQSKPTIVCGDFNVARDDDLDVALPEKWRDQPGMLKKERSNFETLLRKGFIDVYRKLNPGEPNAYTYWNQKVPGERAANIGWRIDYFLLPRSLWSYVVDCLIYSDVMGSDHCPVCLIMSEAKKRRPLKINRKAS